MAKKITIRFDDNIDLTSISKFSYEVYIDDIKIVYNSGTLDVMVQYNTTGDVPPNELFIEANLTDNIAKTLNLLNTYYQSPIITYSVVGNDIEVFIDSDKAVVKNLFTADNAVTLFQETQNTVIDGAYGLKYFFQYKNIVNDEYKFEIYQVGFKQARTEIVGRAKIQKASVKEHLEQIRGTSVQIELEANENLTLEDLYTQNELDFPVKLYKNGKLIFRGYLNPDGVFQSFVQNEWRITLDCVDGLGAIENLSFVKEKGLYFTGKMSAQDIVFNCLKRTGILMNINTSINVFYDGYTEVLNKNILESIFVNSSRFVKDDGKTIMSCSDVLKSILDLFNAVITQEGAEWYIYRPNELYNSNYIEFKKYGINNQFIKTTTENLSKKLGSQIDNYYPHHCNGDQKIQIKGNISAYRINYKYGFVTGLMTNPSLVHDDNFVYEGWTIMNSFWLIKDPLSPSGFIFKNGFSESTSITVKSDSVFVTTEDSLKLKLSFSVKNSSGDASSRYLKMKIQQGSHYLKYTSRGDGGHPKPIDDTVNAIWTTDSNDFYTLYLKFSNTYEIPIPPFQEDGNLSFSIIVVEPSGGITTIDSFDLIVDAGNRVEQGEFHTVQRSSLVSSNIKANKEIYNGDNVGLTFVGAIYEEDETTPTSMWHRKNVFESKPILRISAEDALRIAQRPAQIFAGSFFGYIPFLSILTINNIKGKFLAIDYNYDTFTNVGTVKWLELFNNDLPDIKYDFSLDYGNTVKPTIVY